MLTNHIQNRYILFASYGASTAHKYVCMYIQISAWCKGLFLLCFNIHNAKRQSLLFLALQSREYDLTADVDEHFKSFYSLWIMRMYTYHVWATTYEQIYLYWTNSFYLHAYTNNFIVMLMIYWNSMNLSLAYLSHFPLSFFPLVISHCCQWKRFPPHFHLFPTI